MPKSFRLYQVSIVLVIIFAMLALTGGWFSSNIKATSIRTAAALTTSYVATAVRQIDDSNQLALLVKYTKGSSSSMRLKVEFSENKTDFYQESKMDAPSESGAIEHTLYYHWWDTSGNYPVQIPILGTWYKASVIAITSGTSTSCAITEVKGTI